MTRARLTQRFAAAFIAAIFPIGCGGAAPAPAEPGADTPAAARPARAQLDDVQRLASERQYGAAIAAFQEIQQTQPDAITGLDGLKIGIVYLETGDMAAFDTLTSWLVDRYRTTTAATDAERSVKGYVVHSGADDPALLAHAVERTRYASENAAAQGQGEYQGFFDASRGIAAFRAGHLEDAATWLPRTMEDGNLYVRSLSLAFYAMTELARGNRPHGEELLARARSEAAALPAPGTAAYGTGWTDVLMTRLAMKEAEAAFQP